MSEAVWSDDHWCIACGSENPQGLHLQFHWEGDEYVADFTPQRVHQGWAGIVHGGVLAILLDEAMNDMFSRNGAPVATAELTVRYRKPAKVGVPLQVRARAVRERPPVYYAEADLTDADGVLVATATGKMMRIAAEL
jgi:uncharacterized protein (TIGR00369 family)